MTVREALDRANPNSLADHLRAIGLGHILQAGIPVARRRFNFDAAAASSSQLTTVDTMALDNNCKAASILRATARATAAAGTLGELAAQAYGATPADGQIAVAPNGDVVALAASRYTSVDVVFVPEKLDVVTLDLVVDPATGVCLIPSVHTARGVVLLMAATATAGTVTGAKRILVPGATNPATPQCRLSVAKDAVNFTAADAVSRATLVLGLAPEIDAYAKMLEAEATS